MAEDLNSESEPTPEALKEQLIQLAQSLPRVGDDSHERVAYSGYWDNFSKRVAMMQSVYEGTAEETDIFYVRMVKERFGFDMLSFYRQEQELCDAIAAAVREKQPYDRLVEGYIALQKYEAVEVLPPGSADCVQAAVGHSLGLDAIGMYYWGRLNPLLEEIYVHMEQRTINAPFLTQ